MAVFPAAASGGVSASSPVLEAFVTKVSEVEAEFHRKFSALQDEFRQAISDLQAEYCVRNSAPESGSCPNVTLPSRVTKEQWSVVGSAGKRRRVLRARRRVLRAPCLEEPQVVTTNPFSVVEEVGEEVQVVGADRERKEGADAGTLPQGKVVVLGDSQVRHLDSAFCGRDRTRRTRVCLPGAGIARVSARLDTCLEENGTKPIVVLSAGGNDLGKVRSEELIGKFRLALDRIRDKGGLPVVCGVLPRRGVGVEWLSRAIAVNRRLAEHCRSNGWSFIDNWDLFYGRDSLYARDGVHLSRQGVRVLARTLESEVSALQRFFR